MPDASPDDLRAEVRRLRDESAAARVGAREADELRRELHTARVAATGRLADPTDLPFDAEHLADADTLTAAVDELLTRKPHLASRRPSGDVGQGAREQENTVGLAGMLRAGAG